MGAVDIATKEYLSDPEHFSDAFNFWLYDGKNVIKAADLQEMDTTAIALPYGIDAKIEPVQKIRDVLKVYTAMRDNRTIYLILGLEEQTKTNFAMPVKCLLYDAISYAKQVSEAAKSYRKAEEKLSEEEFLSGFRKEDRLIPVITLTVSFSSEPWNGPRSLHEMLATDDEKILALVPDYRLNLLAPNEIADEEFAKFRTEFGTVMQCVKHKRDKGMDWMKDNERFKKVTRNTASLIKTVTGFNISLDEEGDTVDMMNAWENGLNQARTVAFNDGFNDGEAKGRDTTMVSNIKNFMENSGWSAKRVMDALKIPASEQEKYAKQI